MSAHRCADEDPILGADGRPYYGLSDPRSSNCGAYGSGRDLGTHGHAHKSAYWRAQHGADGTWTDS